MPRPKGPGVLKGIDARNGLFEIRQTLHTGARRGAEVRARQLKSRASQRAREAARFESGKTERTGSAEVETLYRQSAEIE